MSAYRPMPTAWQPVQRKPIYGLTQQNLQPQQRTIFPRREPKNMWLQAPSAKRFRVEPPAAARVKVECGRGANSGRSAEIRFDSAETAAYAMQETDGTMVEGQQINVVPLDAQQGSKLLVHGLPVHLGWKAIKDHFKQWGHVVHVALWGLPEDGATLAGEVRFEDPAQAMEALSLNGSLFGGVPVTVELDPGSQDQAKVKVTGLPQGTRWQELKDHFSSIGAIAFAGIKGVDGVSGKGGMPDMNEFQRQMFAMLASAVGQQQQYSHRPAAFSTPAGGQADELTAEIRFQEPQNAMVALKEMNGELCGGRPMILQLAMDRRTLIVKGLDDRVTATQIRALFASRIGQVTSCEVRKHVSNVAPRPGPTKAARLGGNPGGQAQMFQQAARMFMQSQGFNGAMGQRSTGEVRFEGPEATAAVEIAIENYNGMHYNGSVLSVALDSASQDRTKILITNLPPNTAWQELKDLFSECGPVAFANTR